VNKDSYFRSSGFLNNASLTASDGQVFSIETLPAFLRTLLVADGTVTKALEAYFWEPVEVGKVSQRIAADLDSLNPLLVATPGEVLEREVSLVGSHSMTCYARARSRLVLDLLPERLVQGLVGGELGIGELLREEDVETYREIIHLDYYRANFISADAPAGLSDDQVARSYRIRVGGKPAILVTEFFPLGPYLK